MRHISEPAGEPLDAGLGEGIAGVDCSTKIEQVAQEYTPLRQRAIDPAGVDPDPEAQVNNRAAALGLRRLVLEPEVLELRYRNAKVHRRTRIVCAR